MIAWGSTVIKAPFTEHGMVGKPVLNDRVYARFVHPARRAFAGLLCGRSNNNFSSTCLRHSYVETDDSISNIYALSDRKSRGWPLFPTVGPFRTGSSIWLGSPKVVRNVKIKINGPQVFKFCWKGLGDCNKSLLRSNTRSKQPPQYRIQIYMITSTSETVFVIYN